MQTLGPKSRCSATDHLTYDRILDTRWRWRLSVCASLVEDTISLADLGIPEVTNGLGVYEGERLGLDNQQDAQIDGSQELVMQRNPGVGEQEMPWFRI